MNISIDELQYLASDNGDPEMAFNLGELSEKYDDIESAIKHYSNALTYDKRFSKALFNRAGCFTKLKQFDKAIEDYETLINFHLDEDLVKSLIGNVYCEIGSFDTALKYQNEAIDTNPNRADNYYYRGISKFKANKIEGALLDFEYSLKLNPNQEKVLFQIASIKRQKKDYQGAFETFNKLVLLNPTNGHNLYNRGLINFSLKKFEECLNDLVEAHRVGVVQATQDIVTLFIQRYISNNQVSEAISLFNHLIDICSDENNLSYLYFELGQLEFNQQNFSSALNSLNKSIENNQSNLNALELRGIIYDRLNNFQNAIDDYNKIKSLDINYFNNSANILFNLPLLDERMPFEEKIKLYERAIQLEPNNDTAFCNLGHYYVKTNNLDKALKAFKRAYELSPSNGHNITELCNCLTLQKDWINLKVYLEKAVALGVKNAEKGLEKVNLLLE